MLVTVILISSESNIIVLRSISWFPPSCMFCKFSFCKPDELSKYIEKDEGFTLKTLLSSSKQGGCLIGAGPVEFLFLSKYYHIRSSNCEFWFYKYCHSYPHIHMLLDNRLFDSNCFFVLLKRDFKRPWIISSDHFSINLLVSLSSHFV